MGNAVSAVLIAGFVLAATAAANAEDKVPWKADPKRGAQLAERLCASCHLVGEAKTGTAVAGIPPLKAIAELDGMTRKRVTNALIAPHAPMPDMQITMNEIGDMIAYLEVLIGRELKHGDDDAGGEKLKKPKYPAPS